jgi:hypothetical protein
MNGVMDRLIEKGIMWHRNRISSNPSVVLVILITGKCVLLIFESCSKEDTFPECLMPFEPEILREPRIISTSINHRSLDLNKHAYYSVVYNNDSEKPILRTIVDAIEIGLPDTLEH